MPGTPPTCRILIASAAVLTYCSTAQAQQNIGDKLRDANTQVAPTTQPGSNPPALPLTLDQALTVGLNNSKSLRITAEAVNRAHGVVNENRAGFMPSVNGAASFTRLDKGASFTLAGPNGQPVTVPIVLQSERQVTVNANLPLDLSGLIRAAVQQSEFQEIAARLEYNRTRNET